jgi:hypothetical protein
MQVYILFVIFKAHKMLLKLVKYQKSNIDRENNVFFQRRHGSIGLLWLKITFPFFVLSSSVFHYLMVVVYRSAICIQRRSQRVLIPLNDL